MFAGIPVEALDFYEDLAADNSKVFWQAHKDVYERSVREPFNLLLAELEPEFGSGKIFRPYRDVRFSKDKSPYKTAQGAFIGTAPGLGYYLQIDAAGLFVAGGFYQAGPEQLARYRQAVDHDVRGPELVAIVDSLTAAGYTLGGDTLKTQPRGFDSSHPRIELLRHKSLTVSRSYGSPAWLHTERAAKEVRSTWNTIRPLVEWLTAVLG